jgi:epoxyqueuosine reductase
MALLDDPAPVVRGAAVWALGRLDPAGFATERATRRADEKDSDVAAEWDAEIAAAPAAR